MALVRSAPELQAAARDRSGLTVTAVADRIAGVVTGARLAAQVLADRTGETYIDALDRVMARLEQDIPLGEITLGQAGTGIGQGIVDDVT